MAKRLIVNADDFGLSPGINRGILDSYQRGILTSTTVMVNMPHVADGIPQLERDAPGLGVGLHFTLSQGKPVLPAAQVPSLVTDDSTFVIKHVGLFERIERFQPTELAAEMNAQFERFVALAGREPDHLDSHHHLTYMIPAAYETLLELAHEHRLPLRNGGAYMSAERWRTMATNAGHTDMSAADRIAEALQQVYDRYPHPRWPDTFESSFYSEGATRDHLTSILTGLPDGVTEIMCHPGYPEDIEPGYYAAPRRTEVEVLTDPAIAALVADLGIERITFSDLPL